MRSTAGPVTRRRHKKIMRLAKGYRGLRKNVFGTAKVTAVAAPVAAPTTSSMSGVNIPLF